MYKSKKSNHDNQILNQIERDLNRKHNLKKNLSILKGMNSPCFRLRILNDIGTSYLLLGQFDNAMQIFEQLIKEDPSYHTAYKITKLLMSIGNINQAFECVELLKNPDEQDFFNGYINKKIGNYDEAINYFKKLRFTLMEYQGLLEMGHCYLELGDLKNAKTIYQKLLTTNEKEEALIFLIEIAFIEKDPNVDKLIKKFDVENCQLRRLIQKYQRCVSYYKFINGQLKKNNLESYYESQLFSYNKQKALEHIEKRHQIQKDYRYQFLKNIDIKPIYDYCTNNLEKKLSLGTSEICLCDYPEDVGFIGNVTTNRLKMTVIPGTNKILTMFPVANYDRMMNKKERNDESVR